MIFTWQEIFLDLTAVGPVSLPRQTLAVMRLIQRLLHSTLVVDEIYKIERVSGKNQLCGRLERRVEGIL